MLTVRYNGEWVDPGQVPYRLGDRVAAFAKPIARRLDRWLGTDLSHCSACERRRRALNRFSAWARFLHH